MWIKVQRVVKSGFYSFWRNGFISLSSVLVMVVTLLVIGGTIFSGVILKSTFDQIKDQVDMNVSMVRTASESDVLAFKKTVEQLPEVVSPVVYTSREDVLANFKKKHGNDELTLQAIDEVGDNPFGASLTVKAKDPSQYEGIVNFFGLSGTDCTSFESKFPVIDKINYCDNKEAISHLSNIIKSADRLGFVMTIFLILISILITFNTLRLVIYMSRDEISVMRLVGASVNYIRGPFFVAGAIYGFISAIITLILFYPITIWLGSTTEQFFSGLNIFHYYAANFGQIFLIIVGSGVAIGAISSFLAVRKYLKV